MIQQQQDCREQIFQLQNGNKVDVYEQMVELEWRIKWGGREDERIKKEIQGEIAKVKGHFQNSMEA